MHDILDLAKIEAGRMELADFHLLTAIDNAVGDGSRTAEGHGRRLRRLSGQAD